MFPLFVFLTTAFGAGLVLQLLLRFYRLPKFPRDRVDAFLKRARSGPIAHRGGIPENTLRAFHLSKTDGAIGVEVDLQFSKDGHPVLIHDSTVERTSNGQGRVQELTLEQLRELDFGVKFGYKPFSYPKQVISAFSPMCTSLYIARSLLASGYQHCRKLWTSVKSWTYFCSSTSEVETHIK